MRQFTETVIACVYLQIRDCDIACVCLQIHARWGPSTKHGKWTWDSTPNQEAICNQYLLAKGESFSPMK